LGQDGLAAAALADETERLTPPDGEADPIDRVDVAHGAAEEAGAEREVLDQVLDPQQIAVGPVRTWLGPRLGLEHGLLLRPGEPAGGAVVRADRRQLGLLLAANLGPGATRPEAAAARRGEEIGRQTLDRHQPALDVRAQPRHRA